MLFKMARHLTRPPRHAKTRRSAGKAAASEGPRRYTPHFVWAVRPYSRSWRTEKPPEGLNDARTLLADFFNSLPDEGLPLAPSWAWTVACGDHAYDDSKNISRPAPRL